MDNDWCIDKRGLMLRDPLRSQLEAQLDMDAAFLASCDIMDYSLVVGVHSDVQAAAKRMTDAPEILQAGSCVVAQSL